MLDSSQWHAFYINVVRVTVNIASYDDLSQNVRKRRDNLYERLLM